MVIIAIIWYCKRFQKYHVTTDVQSDITSNLSFEGIELETNPSYGTLRKEAHQNTVDYHDEMYITAIKSYTPF